MTPARHIQRILVLAISISVGFVLQRPSAVEEPAATSKTEATNEGLDFNSDIRPILARNCFLCHGPDSSTRQAGLRLDIRPGALAPTRNDGAAAVVPGDSEVSMMIRRIESDDKDFQMPPSDRLRLAPAEIELLRRWIEQGAPYVKHWAWTPIHRSTPPTNEDPNWSEHPVDRFIYDKLVANGLSPAGPAERATLIRRLTFDLIGLPPSPEEVEAFLEDKSPDAWEKLVDRLLDSQQFGERWARHWLDLVRYAETRGHEYDYPIRYAWQYRDYVIRALNGDVPYDQFVTEHIAGDLLDSPRRHPQEQYNESIIGTGFWFLSQGTHAPVDVRADEAERIANQIDVVGKAFLGVTVSCARCHDHKFDPISTADFYAMSGFLQSSRRQEAYLDPKGRIAMSVAELSQLLESADDLANERIPPPGEIRMLREYAAVAAEIISSVKPTDDEQAETSNDTAAALDATINEQAISAKLDRDGLARWVAALQEPPSKYHPAHELVQALVAPAPEDQTNDQPKAEKSPQIFETFDSLDRWQVTGHAFADRSLNPGQVLAGSGGFRLAPPGTAHSGRLASRLQGTLRSETFEIPTNTIVYRVSGRKGRVRLTIDGYFLDDYNPLLFEGITFDVNTTEDDWIDQRQNVKLYRGHRAHIEIVDDGDGYIAVDQIRFVESGQPSQDASDVWPTGAERDAAGRLQEAVTTALKHWNAGTIGLEEVALVNWLLDRNLIQLDSPDSDRAPELEELFARAATIDKELPAPMRVLAMVDGTPEDEYVFLRGDHRSRGELVPRRFINSMAGADQPLISHGSGRLELARRLLSPDNPLPSRVMANRVFHHLFGEGIVPTPDDFGALGQPPSDLPLLDWLADWFRSDADWSVKSFVRLLVTSQAYRMSSASADPATKQFDPTNRLLHRGRIRRLEAEAIRDAVLAVSGRLDPTMYGPSVPVNLTPFMTGRGRPGKSGPLDGNGRRSIYIALRRNFRSPMMTAFDAPVPASTRGRRHRSNVPAQALMMMNDPFVIEQAAIWARRVLRDDELTPTERIDVMFRQAFARAPSPDELEVALDFLRKQAQLYGPDEWTQSERAWADLAHALFNTKEFMFIP
ncbi:MAG: PSD1 and planctomycete cytochrome C domain-containing protein [Phycisphaerales bacterium]